MFYREVLLAPRPNPKLEDHPLSAVHDCLFNLFAATLHKGGSSSIRNLRTRHALVTGTHYTLGVRGSMFIMSRLKISSRSVRFEVPEGAYIFMLLYCAAIPLPEGRGHLQVFLMEYCRASSESAHVVNYLISLHCDTVHVCYPL